MKILKSTGHQGDTQWFSIDKIPESAKKVEKQFIAASERSGSLGLLLRPMRTAPLITRCNQNSKRSIPTFHQMLFCPRRITGIPY